MIAITESVIPDIEQALGFPLYCWQKDYILGKTAIRPDGRQTGKTTAYIVRMCLEDGKPLHLYKGQTDYSMVPDEPFGRFYAHAFRNWTKDIYQKLRKQGLDTRVIYFSADEELHDTKEKKSMGEMQDTGKRITYNGGAQREPHQGKGRYDWISPFGWEEVAKVGQLKFLFAPDGVPRGMVHALGEINRYRKGFRDRSYLAEAAWLIMDLIHKEETGDDMPLGGFGDLSPYALKRLADWCEAGGAKYGDRNWEKGMPYDHPLDSCLRHINKFRMGMTDEDHLAAAVWNLFALMHYEACHMDRFDNIPRYPEASGLGTDDRTGVLHPESIAADQITAEDLSAIDFDAAMERVRQVVGDMYSEIAAGLNEASHNTEEPSSYDEIE